MARRKYHNNGALGNRKIDTWHVRNPDETWIKYDIRLENINPKFVSFTATCVTPGFNSKLEDATPGGLWDKIKAHAHATVTVNWEPWIRIETTSQNRKRRDDDIHETYLSLTYTLIDRANIGTETEMHRPRDGDSAWHCHPFKSAYVEDGVEWESDDTTKALIPETPEAVAALDKIIEAMHQMGSRIREVMANKKVAKTLATARLDRLLGVDKSPKR